MTLDHSRTDWYGSDGPVLSSSGTPRPSITPVSRVVVHYAGAGTRWVDLGDTAQEIRNIQNYASGAGKPWEYNAVVDSASETWEYSGEYRAAHNGGGNAVGQFGNGDSLGVIALYGLEVLTDDQCEAFVVGLRKFRRQAVEAGWLTAEHEVARHSDVRVGGTACPGMIGQAPWWGRITAPLDIPGDTDMTPLPTPIRVYDTRLTMTSSGPFKAGESRYLPIAMSDQAHVHVTCIAQGGKRGYVSVSPSGDFSASLVNYPADGQAIAGGAPVQLAGGHLHVFSSQAAHVIIDVYATS